MRAMNQSQLDMRTNAADKVRDAAAAIAVFVGDLEATGIRTRWNLHLQVSNLLDIEERLREVQPKNRLKVIMND
jgi:hypothetical protein